MTRWLVIVSAILCGPAASADQASPDCGVKCLYLLLQLEARPRGFDQVRALLPPLGSNGTSMADIQAAARRRACSCVAGGSRPTRLRSRGRRSPTFATATTAISSCSGRSARAGRWSRCATRRAPR